MEWKVSDREVVMQENLEIRETVAPPSEYAAIRAFFDVMVQRHVVILNPALSVRTDRYVVVEGRNRSRGIREICSSLAGVCIA